MAQTPVIPVLVINLERDVPRRELILEQFASLRNFDVRLIEALYGPSLPDTVRRVLSQDTAWSDFKGTIGCFLSHVKAWEEVARLQEDFGLVIEDDVIVRDPARILSLKIPGDAEIVFLNDRMSPNLGADAPFEPLPIWHALKHLDTLRSGGPGGDGYLLTPQAAVKLLAACRKDFFFGHVDGRLLRYATSEEDLATLAPDTWIGKVIRQHHHPRLMPTLGLLRGYCLSRPLIRHRGVPSSREAGDNPDPRA